MYELKQNDRERILDQKARGLLTLDQANVEMVICERVRVIRGTVPARVRSALNAAVKAGTLGHFKRDGLRPEVYYAASFGHLAYEERERIARAAVRAISAVTVSPLESATHDFTR